VVKQGFSQTIPLDGTTTIDVCGVVVLRWVTEETMRLYTL